MIRSTLTQIALNYDTYREAGIVDGSQIVYDSVCRVLPKAGRSREVLDLPMPEVRGQVEGA